MKVSFISIDDENNKINEMYSINGNSYTPIQEAIQNDVVAVKGLKDYKVGTYLPSLQNDNEINNEYTNIIEVEGNKYNIYNEIKVLNDELPELNILLNNDNLYISLKGELQKEIVKKLLKKIKSLNLKSKNYQSIQQLILKEASLISYLHLAC